MFAFIFTFQENLWGELSAIVGEIFTDLIPLISIIIGVSLGLYVIARIIEIIRR